MAFRVMVVDDEPDVELLFKQRFRKELRTDDISLDFVLSGEEAIKFLNSLDPFDLVLVLSDINMPGMTGLELLKLIKEKYSHLKVFMVSAYGDEENHSTAKQFGADDFVNKPVDFALLKEKIFNLKDAL